MNHESLNMSFSGLDLNNVRRFYIYYYGNLDSDMLGTAFFLYFSAKYGIKQGAPRRHNFISKSTFPMMINNKEYILELYQLAEPHVTTDQENDAERWVKFLHVDLVFYISNDSEMFTDETKYLLGNVLLE